MKILCSICARAGSKGIKNKNILKINGKSLIERTILQAKKTKIFHSIVVSTDSIKIKKIAQKLKVNYIINRNRKLSSDHADKLSVIKNLLFNSEKYFNKRFDIIIDLDVTSPLRTVLDIKKSYKKFINKNSSNLLSVCKARKNPYFNLIEFKNNKYNLVKRLGKKKYFNRQSTPLVYEANAAIYIWKRITLIKSNSLFNNRTSLYVMPFSRSIDIDNREDLKLVKFFLNNN